MKDAENRPLLDKEGEWIFRDKAESLEELNNKFGVGFTAHSHQNIYGFLGKGMTGQVEIPGYYCSHFRLLSDQERKDLT